MDNDQVNGAVDGSTGNSAMGNGGSADDRVGSAMNPANGSGIGMDCCLGIGKDRYCRYVLVLMAVSAVVRALCAALMEFGNDEVYYRLYALFPDWSHFDHPGMVGWMIQLFTLNLTMDSELAIRMASIVLGTVNIWLMFLIGSEAGGDRRTGWYSALLYVSSIYATVICGIFIMPDTPQSTFWLLSLLCFLRAFRLPERQAMPSCGIASVLSSATDSPSNAVAGQKPTAESGQEGDRAAAGWWMLAAGLACGLAFLSKYTSAFLWTGAGLYIIFHDRRWLRRWELYAAAAITAVCMLPVLVWNMQNDFISFTFHTGRVVSEHQLHPEFFGREIAGEFFYNNPVLFVLTVAAVVLFLRRRLDFDRRRGAYLLWTALPLILIFWAVSWQRATLPHWSGPAFVTLIPLAAAAAFRMDRRKVCEGGRGGEAVEVPANPERRPDCGALPKMNRWVAAAVGFTAVLLPLAVLEIRTGIVPLDSHTEYDRMGKDDFTLDMYGWDQLAEEFAALREEAVAEGKASEDDPVFSYRWFPAAHTDYYVTSPLGVGLLCIGPMEDIHKYSWINLDRGGLRQGQNGWFITSSRDYRDPASMPFRAVADCDTVQVMRCGRHVYNFYIYRVEGLSTDNIEQ